VEADPRVTVFPPAPEQGGPAAPGALELSELLRLLQWNYPNELATRVPAKSSVTVLRRKFSDETELEAPMAPFSRSNALVRAERTDGELTAAEVGTAHHRFLQRVSLAKVGSEDDLKSEVQRLRQVDFLSAMEAAALDLAALAEFWRSEPGRAIRANAPAVRRELPFTARFSAADLAAASPRAPQILPPAEFIVVQGVADLAVILPAEIWLLDFKTDSLTEHELEAKVEFYRPQLQLYGNAFERIYRRSVTARWLHLLSLRRTVAL
jgi:ATP-dependent helicase/nuclease subunit A